MAEVAQSSTHTLFDGDNTESLAFIFRRLYHLCLDIARLQAEQVNVLAQFRLQAHLVLHSLAEVLDEHF